MIWYIDPINGSNDNSGHTMDSPLLDLSKFTYKGESEPVLNHGDKILIKRGTTLQCKDTKIYTNNFEFKKHPYVYVGAYGTGDNPILTHHKVLNRSKLMKYTDHIYYVDLSISGVTTGYSGEGSNVGFIYDAICDEIHGNRVFEMGKLENFMDFYIEDDKLYIYSYELELIPEKMILPLGNTIMTCDANTIYENLHFTLGGVHGLNTTSDGNYNIIVKNCMFSKLGGSLMSGTTRYGNGFEVFGSASDIQVQNCIFEDIYDTGVTYQGNNSTFENISFNHNVFKRCGQACENWCDNKESGEGYINCTFNDNLCLLSGYGFGGKNRDLGYHFMLTNANCKNTDITVKNNIFFKAKNGCYGVVDSNIKFAKNKIYLYDDQFINKYNEITMKDYQEYKETLNRDKSSKFIVLESKNKNGVMEEVLLVSDLFMNNINHIYSNASYDNDYSKQNNQLTKLNLTSYVLEEVSSQAIVIVDNQVFVNLKAKMKSDISAYNTFAYNNSFEGYTCDQQYINDDVYVNIANGQLYLQSNKALTKGEKINISGVFTIKEV